MTLMGNRSLAVPGLRFGQQGSLPSRKPALSDASIVAGMAVLVLAVHLATNAQYDFHRDSL